MGSIVTLPDGKTASFPAGMTPQQIQDALDADPTYGIGSVMARPGVPAAPLPAGLQGPPTPAQPPSLAQKALTGAENFGIGAAKGALHTISSSDQWARNNLPAFMTNSDMGFGPPANLQHVQQMTVPTTPAQKAGRFTEQAGEFLAPGLGEDAAGAKLAEVAPAMGRFAEPVGRVLAAAAGTGAVNRAQGGSFTTGAALGAGGGVVGEGLRAVAPYIAESALGVRGADRAFGRTPGQAIIEDTKGVRPGTVARSAFAKSKQLTRQMESNVDAATQRMVQQPTIRGLLSSPVREIPLGSTPTPGEMPGALLDVKPFPPQNVGEARIIRNPNGQIMPLAERNIQFPDANGKLPPLRNYNGQMLTQQPTRKAFMTGAEDSVDAAPPISGPGVWQTRNPMVPPADANPYRAPLQLSPDAPNVTPARKIVGEGLSKATAQGSPELYNPLQTLQGRLSTNPITGEAISSQVTPRQMLNLKRGIGALDTSWTPETQKIAKTYIRNVYGALDNELDRTVPGNAELNQRISSLIPTADRANAKDLSAPIVQRVAGRLRTHAGALMLGGLGAYAGNRKGGAGEAVKLGLLGALGPEVLLDPAVQMSVARIAANPSLGLAGARGGALQAVRGLYSQNPNNKR